MNIELFGILLSLLIGASLFIAFSSSNNINSTEDYFLAGRKFSLFATTFSLLATQLGGGVIIGTSQAAYQYGALGIFYSLGLALGLILLSLVNSGRLREQGISTIAEVFEKVYGSKLLRKIAAVLSILSLWGIYVAMIVSSKKLLLSMGIDSKWLLIALWLILISYTSFGGIKAVVNTDILQVLVIIACFVIVYIMLGAVNPEVMSWDLDYDPNIMQDTHSLLLVPMMFVLVEQDMAQRIFAAKSALVARVAAFIAGIALLAFSMIPVLFGMMAKNQLGGVSGDASVLLQFVQQVGNPNMVSILVVGIIAAIISTADSLLCALSSNLIVDLCDNDKKSPLVTYAKVVTFVMGFVAIIVALCFSDVLKIILASYELVLCACFVPVVAIYLGVDKGNQKAAQAAFATGLISFILFLLLAPSHQWRALICIGLSLAAFMAGVVVSKIALRC
jgi:SSS family solute:Na+ symporter